MITLSSFHSIISTKRRYNFKMSCISMHYDLSFMFKICFQNPKYVFIFIQIDNALFHMQHLLVIVGHFLESICVHPKVIPLSSCFHCAFGCLLQIKNQVAEEKKTNILASQLNTNFKFSVP